MGHRPTPDPSRGCQAVGAFQACKREVPEGWPRQADPRGYLQATLSQVVTAQARARLRQAVYKPGPGALGGLQKGLPIDWVLPEQVLDLKVSLPVGFKHSWRQQGRWSFLSSMWSTQALTWSNMQLMAAYTACSALPSSLPLAPTSTAPFHGAVDKAGSYTCKTLVILE